jgi:cytochrome c oxidase subunit 2
MISQNPIQGAVDGLRKGITPISNDVYQLHVVAMLICAFIGIIVFGIMIYSILHHRKSKEYQAANWHENHKLEIIWSIIPFLILIALALPAIRVLIH